MVEANSPRCEADVERIKSLLVDFAGESHFLVDGLAAYPGDDRAWIRVYATDDRLEERWWAFGAARSSSFRRAQAEMNRRRSLLSLADTEGLGAERHGLRRTLAQLGDGRLRQVVVGLEAGRVPTETDWILDVPEQDEEHVLSYWALTETS